MELNKQVGEILKGHNIDVSVGYLILLGIYFDLDIEKVYSEEAIKAINITKIVEKDYKTNSLTWNIPLFADAEAGAFDWVRVWMDLFSAKNPERRGSVKDAITRMKKWFAENPEYRREDVFAATQAYMNSLNNAKYCMHSHKFIFDGIGAMKKSTLLQWCEKLKEGNQQNVSLKGRIAS